MTDADIAALDEAFADVRCRIWFCPVRRAHGTPPFGAATVEWRGDVAHCLHPGCGRTSADGPLWPQDHATDITIHADPEGAPVTMTAERPAREATRPMDNTTAILDTLFNDLDTYRYMTGIKVTPAMARRLINLNAANNRNIKDSLVARYTRDMTPDANGRTRWRSRTGQTVKIGTDGRVLDGAHRMHAVDRSGHTVEFDLAFGVDPADIVVVDNGGARSADDVIKIAGGEVRKGTSAVVRWTWAWDLGAYRGTTGRLTPTAMEILDLYEANPGAFDAAAARGADLARTGLLAASPAATGYYLLNRVDTTTAGVFYDQFVSGTNLKEGDAIKALRDRLTRRRIDRITPAEQLALIIRAWNNYNTLDRDGNRVVVERLQLTREGKLTNANFPMPRKAAKGDVR